MNIKNLFYIKIINNFYTIYNTLNELVKQVFKEFTKTQYRETKPTIPFSN